MDHAHKEHVAANEASFRALNESLETKVHARLVGPHAELPGFVCECGDADCAEVVRMTTMQYEEIRRDPRLFFVRPGHEIGAVEDVVRREEGFLIVRKREEVADIVHETDPRSP